MTTFTERVVRIIQSVPAGKVMTYGQIAALAGNPRGARQVVRILHSMSQKYDLPWHRIINAKGEIAIKDDEGSFTQKDRLISEGIVLTEAGKVNLIHYRYHPTTEWIPEEY
ncbi:MGMT family protein [Desemzia sp. RIT804]|uniref:MGMT family protein n=1 Tax=Desemzia sp. RIT 804 TaxID=2810209 RepID=UPI0019525FBC|nr:MGMT family protein [Desemzia sp. RIT 804]MBM6615725.1 MGMT family protein [Desemzia sp. RIT 804]